MNMAKKFKKYKKDVINGYVYVEKISMMKHQQELV